MKYNPKTSKDKDAEMRFIEISDAYSHLSNELKRREYDQYIFGELLPVVSQSIFSDFFN
jgi:DnaJ-class molecular chaperone